MTFLHYFFDLTSFYRLGQKYKNILVHFLVQMKTLKIPFEINWPLTMSHQGQRKRKGSIWVSLDPITISFLEWHWINQLWGRTILLFYHQCFSKLAILHSISCLLANFVPSHIHTYIKPIWQMGTLEFHLHTNFMEKVRCRQKYTYQTFFVKKDVN